MSARASVVCIACGGQVMTIGPEAFLEDHEICFALLQSGEVEYV